MSESDASRGPDTARASPRIAFFGLGQMGQPMARKLADSGFDVCGVDAQPEARERFEAAGFRTAPPHEAVAEAEVIITILPDGKAVANALLGGDPAVADVMRRGALVVEMTSSSPVETLELGEALEARGIGLIDAPVSGGVQRARAAELAIMAGGPSHLIDQARPVLQAMGSSIFQTGPLGSGHAMKALNNYVSAAGLAAASEALLIGRKFGLDSQVMVDVLNASSGRNNSTEVKMKPFVLSGAFNSGFGLALMAKDLKIADDLAHHLGLAAPLCGCCSALWSTASESVGKGADHTEIFRYLEGLRDKGE